MANEDDLGCARWERERRLVVLSHVSESYDDTWSQAWFDIARNVNWRNR
jgi:hypothetical protein